MRRRQVETINGERKGKAKTQGGETWLRTEDQARSEEARRRGEK